MVGVRHGCRGSRPPGAASVNADYYARSVGRQGDGIGLSRRVASCISPRAEQGLRSRRGQHYCLRVSAGAIDDTRHSGAIAGFVIRITWRVHGTLCRRNAGHPSRVPRQVAAPVARSALIKRAYRRALLRAASRLHFVHWTAQYLLSIMPVETTVYINICNNIFRSREPCLRRFSVSRCRGASRCI